MIHQSHWSSIIAALGLLAGLSGCGDDDDGTNESANPATGSDGGVITPTAPGSDGGASTPGTAPTPKDPLVVMTEQSSPERSLHYLHVLAGWPTDGKLDFGKSIELGEPGVAHVEGDQFYHWRGPSARLQRFTIDDKLLPQKPSEISFGAYGIASFDPEIIWVSPELAYMVDDSAGQLIRFNPAALRIDGTTPVSPAVYMRDGVKAQFQHGLEAGGRLFTTASWYDYKGKGVDATVIGVFDEKSPANGPQLVEDTRCTRSVANGVWEDGDYVYAVSDAANAFAVLADPVAKTPKPQCVLRMRKDASAFDQDYLVDLKAVTGSPAIRMTWPMKGNKLLVNLWAPAIDPTTVLKPGDDGKSFWEATAWTYAVVDLTTRTSKLVTGIPPAGAQSTKLLVVDEENYLQIPRADKSSILYRVNADAGVTQVLDLPIGAKVEFLGRLKPAKAK